MNENILMPAGQVQLYPAGQVVVDTRTDGASMVGSLLGLALSIGVMYGAAYYGARAGVKAAR